MTRLLIAAIALLSAIGFTPSVSKAADAQAALPDAAVQAFEHFIRQTGPLCQSEASTLCVGQGWRFADSSGDGRVSLREMQAVRAALVEWAKWRGDSLRAGERLGIHGGVWLVDTVGLDKLFASFDADGDSALSLAELLADVSLDERPLGAVLLDPEAVDRQAISQRLGQFAPMLEGLLRKY